MGLLSSKVVVITGAGGGVGQAVTRLFAREGAALVINDLGCDTDGKGSTPAVITELGNDLRHAFVEVRTHTEDVSTQQGAESLIRLAVVEFGRVDVLVNCAAISREQSILNMRDKDLVAVLDVQVIGSFRCLQAAAIAMRQAGGGRIIYTTSPTALSGNFGQCASSTAASAMIGLTRAAAAELLRHRVYVNAIAPLAKTRQTEELPLFQKSTNLTPEHVARGYLYLASEASGDVTGEVLIVAGDRVTTLRSWESAATYAASDNGLLSIDEIQQAVLQGARST